MAEIAINCFPKGETKMAGRPRAPTTIVDPDTIITVNALRQEFWINDNLFPEVSDLWACIQWLARRGLLANSRPCAGVGAGAEEDGHLMTLVARQDAIDDKEWKCRRHNKRKSLRAGSWFDNSKLTLKQVVYLVYYWSCDLPQKLIRRELCISAPKVVDWMNFVREVCQEDLHIDAQVIGGVDPVTGDPIVVEIDETKYFHRKYHRGEWREGHWVFGGIERGSGNCFLVEVPDRTAVTLIPLIRQYILPGTHIVSDGWRPYARIAEIDGGIYSHDVIVHEQHFVHPDDPEVHTQNIENQWMRAKRKLKRQFGTSDALFSTYLAEFMWQQKHKHLQDHYFGVMLACIRVQYPLQLQ